MTPLEHPGPPKMEAKIALGGLKTLKNDPRTFLEAPRARQVNFLTISDSLFSPPARDLATKRPPEASGRPFWTPRGSIVDPPGAPGIVFQASGGSCCIPPGI